MFKRARARERYIHGTHGIRVRSPRSRARHWRAVAPGLLVRGATAQRRDARPASPSPSHPLVLPRSFIPFSPPRERWATFARRTGGPSARISRRYPRRRCPPAMGNPRRTCCQSKEREITSADKGCQSRYLYFR